MPKALIAKETLQVLEENAPKGYDVKEKLFDIDVYDDKDKNTLFEALYLNPKKKDDVAYLHKLIGGMGDYTDVSLAEEKVGEGAVSVTDKMINAHKSAAMVMLDGERAYVHYK